MAFSVTLLVLGILLTALAIRQFVVKRKLIAAGLNGLLGLATLLVSVFVSMLLLNIQSYIQLTKEQVLAEIEISAAQADGAELVLTIDGEHRVYSISADEWRVDARFIKWKPWVVLLGKEPVVRLESLSGRNATTGERVVQVYNLHDDFEIVDQIVTSLTERFGMVDTMYGSSVYMPVETGARYRISANYAGLIARPINETGEKAVIQWDR